MKRAFAAALRCPACGGGLALEAEPGHGEQRENVEEGVLRSSCGRRYPVIAGVPRMLPDEVASTLVAAHPDFFRRHPDLSPAISSSSSVSLRTLRLFGDEWQRFPELVSVHARIFDWYFAPAGGVRWPGRHVLDAGCGMGRWLHFARRAGAEVVGMDVSPAIDVAARREGEAADFVQADLRSPPFPPGSFDLVYSLGVVHHLEDPAAAVQSLARLVRPGGELRLYVYRSLEEETAPRRALLAAVTSVRRVTTRLPPFALHAFAWTVAAVAAVLFLAPRRALRRWPAAERATRGLPLVQYADVPFRMLVAEQFDRFGAPLEGRYRREEVESWLREAGLGGIAVVPELGWRAVGRKPAVTT
jgi:SAM-dependent methyltransferase